MESDKALGEIILNELCVLTECEIRGKSFEETHDGHAMVVAMIDERPKVEPLLGGRSYKVFLKARLVAEALSGQNRTDEDNLIAVISGLNSFLDFADLSCCCPNKCRFASDSFHDGTKLAGWAGGSINDYLRLRRYQETSRQQNTAGSFTLT